MAKKSLSMQILGATAELSNGVQDEMGRMVKKAMPKLPKPPQDKDSFTVQLGKELSSIAAYGVRELTGQKQPTSKPGLKKGWFE